MRAVLLVLSALACREPMATGVDAAPPSDSAPQIDGRGTDPPPSGLYVIEWRCVRACDYVFPIGSSDRFELADGLAYFWRDGAEHRTAVAHLSTTTTCVVMDALRWSDSVYTEPVAACASDVGVLSTVVLWDLDRDTERNSLWEFTGRRP